MREYLVLILLKLAKKLTKSGLTDDDLVVAIRTQKWYMGLDE